MDRKFSYQDCLTGTSHCRYPFRRHMFKVAVVCLVLCGLGPAGAGRLAAERVDLPLMREPSRAIAEASEFVFGVPRHINPQAGSEITMVMHFRAMPSMTREPVLLTLNGHELQPQFSADTRSLALQIRAAVPESHFQAGWNELTALLPREFGTCEVRRAESRLGLNFERAPLFPELRRFPESVAEEKFLRPDSKSPIVSLLVPARRRDVHLRACAIVAARLGQQSYLDNSDCDLLEIGNWPAAEDRNAIIIARSDELANLPMLAEISPGLGALGNGKGLLAEFILGDFPNQRRWILATGGDDAGVEKAALTLGSDPALSVLPPSPAEIAVAPEVSPALDLLAQPSPKRVTFKELGWRDIQVGRHPEHRFGWRLPPGSTLMGGELTLNFFHRSETGGVLEVFLGPTRIGRIALNRENAEADSVKLPLPQLAAGTDPVMFTFRAVATNFQYRGPIATVLGTSGFDAAIQPARVSGLEHLDTLVARDSFLRRTALLLQNQPNPTETRLLFDLAMNLGRRLPSSPLLWPQACTFDHDRRPAEGCVAGRSALLLAPVSAWRYAVPRKSLLIQYLDENTVRIQGRRSKIADFEPTLTLMQLMRAPWQDDEWVVGIGGWRDLDVATTKTLISRAAVEGKIYGNMAAADAQGRFTAHESRRPANVYFAQRLKRDLPTGLGLEETNRRLAEADARRGQSLFLNRFLIWFVGIFIGLIVLGRLLLLWERARHYKESETSVRTAS
jgi:hypothetical protein